MKILVTTGNTQVPIDRVRCITNVFTGKTGTHIAEEALQRGHDVILVTSHPELVRAHSNLVLKPYATFDDLRSLMAEEIPRNPDAIIHSAAITDYKVQGIYHSQGADAPQESQAGKVRSHHKELWLRLTPTPKLVDMIRRDWGFKGILVKFKLEVDQTEAELLEIAEKSRLQSRAELMVANTLESKDASAWIGPMNGNYQKVARKQLPSRLIEKIKELHG